MTAHHFHTRSLLLVIVVFVLVPTGKVDAYKHSLQDECPLSVETVRKICGIPPTIVLEKGQGYCGVATKGTLSYNPPILTFDLRTAFYPRYTTQRIKDTAVGEIVNMYNPLAEPRVEDLIGIADQAFVIPHPSLIRSHPDYQAGLKDVGFSFFAIQGGQVGSLVSKGADVYVQQEGGTYKPIGAGCDKTETLQLAKEVIVPHLAKLAAEAGKKQTAQDKVEHARAEKERALAKKFCPPITKVSQACKGPVRLKDVRASTKKQGSLEILYCNYTSGGPTAITEAVGAFNMPLKAQTYLATQTQTSKDARASRLGYGLTSKVLSDVIKRNEVGEQSTRTENALIFLAGKKMVVLTELNGNKTCTSKELLKVGALFK